MSVLLMDKMRFVEIANFIVWGKNREINRQSPNGYGFGLGMFGDDIHRRTKQALELVNQLQGLNYSSFKFRYKHDKEIQESYKDFDHIYSECLAYFPDVFQFIKNLYCVSYQIEGSGRKSPVYKKLLLIISEVEKYLLTSILEERSEWKTAKWG